MPMVYIFTLGMFRKLALMGPTIFMNHAAICDHTVYVAAVVFMKTTIVLTSVSGSQTTTQPQGKSLLCERNEIKTPPIPQNQRSAL